MAQLCNKRITGYLNYKSARGKKHSMRVLEHLLAHLSAEPLDHIICTGDLVNIGLEAEYVRAAAFMQRLGDPTKVSYVAGNHDVYVRGVEPFLHKYLGEWLPSSLPDQPFDAAFPFITSLATVESVGKINLIGVSTAVPTPPFFATGRVGAAQRERLKTQLNSLNPAHFNIVAIHHPPIADGFWLRRLTDAAEMQKILCDAPVNVVLHGHNHRFEQRFLRHSGGKIPVIGVPAASMRTKQVYPNPKTAAYHVFEISAQTSSSGVAQNTWQNTWQNKWTIRLIRYLFDEKGLLHSENLML
jgi:3',5'-cyclic AMP phosphodiesterase CpdA